MSSSAAAGQASPAIHRAWALVASAVRYWLAIFPTARRELRHWEGRARAIPNPALRRYAILSLRCDRANIEGAALFATLAQGKSARLVRLLVCYEIICDYLDTLAERAGPERHSAVRRGHRALADALAPAAPRSDYYAGLPWSDDGGYLAGLVGVCQRLCASLPSYSAVEEGTRRAAERFGVVQSLNHTYPPERVAGLKRWASQPRVARSGVSWFEACAAASSPLAVYGLLGLAANQAAAVADAHKIEAAYYPWIGALNILLDSLVDEREDSLTGNHSYIAHYPSRKAAADRLRIIASNARRQCQTLPAATKHEIILAGMVSRYLASPELRAADVDTVARSARATMGIVVWPLAATLRLRGLAAKFNRQRFSPTGPGRRQLR